MKPRPSLVRNFVGREDILEKMRQTHIEARSPDPGLPAITVLMGLGGSGKTQTALKFTLDYEKR
jgi:Holliday junction resolvasome RuvABC ATP-dependent DNA helicase subunit